MSIHKLFFGILAGVAAYAIIGLSGLYLLKICWADYAIAARDKSYIVEMLLARLFIGIIASIAAGIGSAKISDSRKSVWFAASIIFAYAAYTHFVKVWPDYPVWYHLAYLLPIIPVILLSNYFLQKGKSDKSTKMKNKIPSLFLIIFFLNVFLSIPSFAQTTDNRIKNIEASYPIIDALFEKYAVQNHFPGMVYGLMVGGKLVHTGNMGYTNLSEKITADTTSAFRIASMTKSFVAMAILKLRDEGKLKLDDPVYLTIPEMKGQHYLTKDAAPITIRHLLMHGAGFPEDNPWGDRQLAITDKNFIEFLKKGISFSNNPGQQYEYSNLGFAMLGYIIRKVTGLSYDVYINKNILEPLGMKHTYWEYSKVPPIKLAHGYRWLNEKFVEQPLLHDGTYGAMGGMITSIEDFSKYMSLQLSAWPPRDDADKGPVKRSSLREMQFPWNLSGLNAQYKYPGGRACPIVSAYGYGLRRTQDCEGRVFVGHSGGLPGFGSNWTIMPDYNIGVMCFANGTYAPASFINMQMLDTLVALAKLKPRLIPVSDILNRRKDELIQLLPEWKNPETAHIFADNFFLDYFPESLRREATAIFKNAGKIIRIQEPVAENNLRGSFIMEGENSNIEISFTLTPENPPLIQQYRIRELKR